MSWWIKRDKLQFLKRGGAEYTLLFRNIDGAYPLITHYNKNEINKIFRLFRKEFKDKLELI